MHAGALPVQHEALLVSVLGHDWNISHSPLGIKAHCQESNVKLVGHCLDLQHSIKLVHRKEVVSCTDIRDIEKCVMACHSQLKGLNSAGFTMNLHMQTVRFSSALPDIGGC